MMKKLGAWGLAAAMTLMSGGAIADVAGGPPGTGGKGVDRVPAEKYPALHYNLPP